MATVADILAYIEQIAPTYMKESWDNVGLNCGHLNQQVKKVLVALDPFMDVCQQAVSEGVDLLVTHHALLWTPGFITDANEQGRCALYLIENNVAHINAHTNLDCAPGGVNDQLAKRLGLRNVQVIEPKGVDTQGKEWGLLRQGLIDEQPLSKFLSTVKNNLQCKGLRFVDTGKPAHRVAVGGGACGSEMLQAVAAGCDTFVTADIKYNQFYEAKDSGINLIDAGHFHTENPICGYLAEKLQARFPEITILRANQSDCAEFFV